MIYHVSVAGNDESNGHETTPFRTIGRAAGVLEAGDTCVVHEGVYRESVTLTRSGTAEAPIRIEAASGERVTVSGADRVAPDWTNHTGSIYKTRIDPFAGQLFCDGEMMIEARWPNARFSQMLDRGCWAETGPGSRYGSVVDSRLAETGIDFTGATATLNVAHQFYTWTRTVISHSAGSDTFTYARDLPGITHYADKTTPWESNVYYLSGILDALDTPTEWYYDEDARELYFWAPDDGDPTSRSVEVKRRDYGFVGKGVSGVSISGLCFFACTVSIEDANRCEVSDCTMLFPTYAQRLTDGDPAAADENAGAAGSGPTPRTLLAGERNVFQRCSLRHSSTGGFTILGSRNVVSDCLVDDFCWNGSLRYLGILTAPRSFRTGHAGEGAAEEGRNLISYCTVGNGGNACVAVEGSPANIVEYCHIHDGGKACKDVSLLYTQLPTVYGTVFRNNWVHDCHAPHIALGIRGDDQTRGLIVHHNVVWNCSWEGIVVKGDENRIYHNTCFDNGIMDIRVDIEAEPEKPWRKQWPLLSVQNENSETFNNCAADIRGSRKPGTNDPPGGIAADNFSGDLADRVRHDFRPAEGSQLVDAGRRIPGINDDYVGDAPDVGAYERGGDNWRPGARLG